jgi:hypothetical protein
VDAIIALSIIYKAFDNMGGFERVFGWRPDTRFAVLVFGLFHGFGLATTLQDYSPSEEGLLTNMLSFNVGIELGQIAALTGVLIALGFWRTSSSFPRQAWVANTILMACGFVLMGYQIVGFLFSAA